MKYNNYIRDILEFIERNITNDIDLEKVANFAGFSKYHLHRIFKSYTGYSVIEYVRLQKFFLALKYFNNSKLNILEISMECGFESQENFTRAFKKFFNITPGKMRRDKKLIEKHLTDLKLTIDIAIKGKIKGGNLMKSEILYKEEFYVVGLRYFGVNQNGEIPALWNEFNKRYDEIENKISDGCMGLCEHIENYDPNSSESEYICCCEVLKPTSIPNGMILKKIPSQKYLKFIHKGPIHMGQVDLLGETYNKIFGEYLPNHNFHTVPAANFEFYGCDFEYGSEDSIVHLYIPIR